MSDPIQAARQPIPYSCTIQARPGYPVHPVHAERIMDYIAVVAGTPLPRRVREPARFAARLAEVLN